MILGLCALVARTSGECLTRITPGNIGMSILLLSIGAVLLSSPTTFRKNIILSSAASLVGSLLSITAMVVQVLDVGATWLDDIIRSQSFGRGDIVAGLLRGDAFLGYFMLLVFPFVLKTVKEHIIR